MLPAPAYGHGRKRTELRRIKGPGKSEYIITHRHGSEYQKQSVFANVQPEESPSAYNNHEPFITPYDSAPPPQRPPIRHLAMDLGHHDRQDFRHHDQQTVEPIHAESARRRFRRSEPRFYAKSRIREKRLYTMFSSSSSKLSSSDNCEMDHRSPRSLKFAVSLARSDSDKSSSVPLTQTSETGIGHDGVKRLNNTREGDYKVYKENIFNVLSSRYTNLFEFGMPDEAELILQPLPRPNQKVRSPLLTWL